MDQPPRGRRVAFFGGSFDPPHFGHLAIARAARVALHLDTVFFAPVGAQPLKPLGSTASFEDRVAMTRLAIAGEPGFEVSLADAPQPSAAPNYTVDTLRKLRAELPPDGALYCLMGADSFLSLRRWHGAAEIPFVASLVIASRPGQPLDDLKAALPAGVSMQADGLDPASVHAASASVQAFSITGAGRAPAHLYLLSGLYVDISASQVREQIQTDGANTATAPLLPGKVLDYIRSRGLYR